MRPLRAVAFNLIRERPQQPFNLFPLRILLSRDMTSSQSHAGPSRPPPLRSVAPPSRQGMTELDRSQFELVHRILVARIPAATASDLMRHPDIKGQLLNLPRARNVAPDTDNAYRQLRLNVESEEQLPAITREVLEREGAVYQKSHIKLGYDWWTASDILGAVLPITGHDQTPSSFTLTGHIGHMNLRSEWLPYRYVIGQVILDKTKHLRTVVNKLDDIHAEYRYFDMEVIAGEKDYITTLSESGCTFTFDFSLVYWNSRLSTEHARILSLLKPDDVVADVMAGVGPFVLPAAKKGCGVWGNDLNPEGVKWMKVNAKQNKVEDRIRISGLDGNEFIKKVSVEAWTSRFATYQPPQSGRQKLAAAKQARKARVEPSTSTLPSQVSAITETLQNTVIANKPAAPGPKLVGHYIMNLPDSALSFLPSFVSSHTPLLENEAFIEKYPEGKGAELGLVHVYCFTREMEYPRAEKDICQRASGYLDCPITAGTPDFNLYLVRSVAPNKEMYCLTFRLPWEVAFKPKSSA